MSKQSIDRFFLSALLVAGGIILASPVTSFAQGLVFTSDDSTGLVVEVDVTDGSVLRQIDPASFSDDIEAMAPLPAITDEVLVADESAESVFRLSFPDLSANPPGPRISGGQGNFWFDPASGNLAWSDNGTRYAEIDVTTGDAALGLLEIVAPDDSVGYQGDLQPSSGHLFSIKDGPGGDTITVFDPATNTLVTEIVGSVSDMQALTFVADGTLFMVDRESPQSLYTVDPTTGVATQVAEIDRRLSGLEFNDADGTLYGTTSGCCDDPNSLIRIDTTSGAITVLRSYGVSVQNLASDGAGNLWIWVNDNSPYPSSNGTSGYPGKVVNGSRAVALLTGEVVLSGGSGETGNFWFDAGTGNLVWSDNGTVFDQLSASTGLAVGAPVTGDAAAVGYQGDIQPSSGNLFSIKNGPGNDRITVSDPSDGTLVTEIVGSVRNMRALTFRADGTLFMVDSGSPQSLYTVDPVTGVATVVGSNGALNLRLSGLEFDDSQNRLYGTTTPAFSASPNSLVEIDTATGIPTVIALAGATIENLSSGPSNTLWVWVFDNNPYLFSAPQSSTPFGFMAQINPTNAQLTLATGESYIPSVDGGGGSLWLDPVSGNFAFADQGRTTAGLILPTTGLPTREFLTLAGEDVHNADINPVTSELFGLDDSGGTDTIVVIDPATDTLVRTLTTDVDDMQALTFRADGTLFMVNRGSPQSLYTVDTATGTTTRIGADGALNYQLSGLEFVDATGMLYGTSSGCCADPNSLLQIDITTGVATRVGLPGLFTIQMLSSLGSQLFVWVNEDSPYRSQDDGFLAKISVTDASLTTVEGAPYRESAGIVKDLFPGIDLEAFGGDVLTNTYFGSRGGDSFLMTQPGQAVTEVTSPVCSAIESMAVDPFAQLAFVGCDSGEIFYTYDYINDVWTTWLDTSIDLDDGGLAIDIDNQILYFIEESGELHSIDIATKMETLIRDFDFDDSSSEVGATFMDAFLNDPAARVDSDGDGQPDVWERGFGASSTNPSLQLDAFPYDAENTRTIEVQGSTWGIVSASFGAATNPPAGRLFPEGVASFCLSGGPLGGTATVDLDFESLPSDAIWFKQDATGNWAPYGNVVVSGTVASVTVTDGGAGDSVGFTNGVICDPIGPSVGNTSSSPAPIPVLPLWLLTVLGFCVSSMGAFYRRRLGLFQ